MTGNCNKCEFNKFNHQSMFTHITESKPVELARLEEENKQLKSRIEFLSKLLTDIKTITNKL